MSNVIDIKSGAPLEKVLEEEHEYISENETNRPDWVDGDTKYTQLMDLTDCIPDLPDWIEEDITIFDIENIIQGGCASGAYMPAVTYSTALDTMQEYGDDILDYIQNCYDPFAADLRSQSWAGLACHFLSAAVEMWAGEAHSSLEEENLLSEDQD